MRIVIIGSSEDKKVKRMMAEAGLRGHEVEICEAENMIVLEDGGEVRVFEGKRQILPGDILVLYEGSGNIGHGLASIWQKQFGTVVVPRHFLKDSHASTTLLAENHSLEQAGIATPKTAFVHEANDLSALQEHFSLPVVVKRARSSVKKGIALAKTWRQARQEIHALSGGSHQFLIREYIPNEREMRIIAVSDKVITGVQRFPKKRDFLSAFRAVRIEPLAVEAMPEIAELVRKVMNTLHYDMAGVDIVFRSTDQKPFVLDVNCGFRFERVEEVTGVNVAQEIVLYLERRFALEKKGKKR